MGEHLASFRDFADSLSDSENFEQWGRAGKFADVVMSYERSIGHEVPRRCVQYFRLTRTLKEGRKLV